ncbi:hypothetical protein [Peribacillus simplex]|uniref:hypothetical protein n=1 Tax=Peribacillus simplex TaxID=1478 RepID=UPI0036D8EB67
MNALDAFREMNDTGKRKLPKHALLDFLPKRWQKHTFMMMKAILIALIRKLLL